MNTNKIKVWNYESSEVRTIEKDGEPWFVLSDVCKVLEISNSRNISSRLEDDEKGVTLMDTLGGTQKMTIINESGLYSVILRSDKPQAKPFRKWVTSEVLPSIRKTGSYSMQQQLSPMEMIAAMANNAVEMERRLKEAENKVAETSSKLEQALDVFANDTLVMTDWAGYTSRKINSICKQYHLSNQSEKGRLYKELEATARCNLTKRVTEKQKRMKKAGAKYADWKNVAKLDVISDDPKLRVIFDGIVKKFEAKYIQGDNVQMGLVEMQ